MGRRRLNGERYPSGKLKPRGNKPNLEPITGVFLRRIVALAKAKVLDQRLGCQLGILNFNGELTINQTAAGHRVGEIYGRFEGYKRKGRSTRSPSYNAHYGDASIAEELLEPEVLAEREQRIREATEAYERLVGRAAAWDPITCTMSAPVGGHIPPKMRNVIEQLCVEDKAINPMALSDVRDLLDHLAIVFKISSSSMGGNAGHAKSTAVTGRHGPALHFNKHDDVGQTESTLAKPEPKRPNLDRIFWIESVRAVAPEKTDKELDELWEFTQAKKQREIFRFQKLGRRNNVLPFRR